MRRRLLGSTGLPVAEIGFGAGTLGNLYHPVSDAEARAALEAGLAAGIDYFDTAPFYGFGLSERRVGDALRGVDAVLSTKVGRLLAPDPGLRGDALRDGFRSPMPFRPLFDYTYDGIMRSWEASLHRLGVARVNVLFVHDIGAMTHGAEHGQRFAQLADGGGLRALEQLRAAGEIDGFGIGVNEVAVCHAVMAQAHLDVILLAGRYTLLEQAPLQQLLPDCLRAGTALVIGGPYNSGILATGTGSAQPFYDYAPAPPDIVARVARIEAVAARHGVTLAAAALQFPLAHPAVACVLPGLASAARVGQTLRLHGEAIPAAFWEELRHDGLLHPAAPVPGTP